MAKTSARCCAASAGCRAIRPSRSRAASARGWPRLTIRALVLTRFGLLSAVAANFVGNLLWSFPLTLNLSAWYAGYGLIPLLVVLGLAIWSCHTALAGRKLFREGFLEG